MWVYYFTRFRLPLNRKNTNIHYTFESANKNHEIIYKISCDDCTGVYIGQTGRKHKKRLAQQTGTKQN